MVAFFLHTCVPRRSARATSSLATTPSLRMCTRARSTTSVSLEPPNQGDRWVCVCLRGKYRGGCCGCWCCGYSWCTGSPAVSWEHQCVRDQLCPCRLATSNLFYPFLAFFYNCTRVFGNKVLTWCSCPFITARKRVLGNELLGIRVGVIFAVVLQKLLTRG